MSLTVYEQAIALTNRPDLQAETVVGIQLALAYYHSLEDWDNDVHNVTVKESHISFEEDTSMILVSLYEFCKEFSHLVEGENSVVVDGMPYTKGKSSCLLEESTYNISNGLLSFKHNGTSCEALPTVCISYVSTPTFEDVSCKNITSWIANQYPQIIARYASAYVKSVIEDRQMRNIPMDEQTLLRANLGA